jgi:predicted amidohydrolase
MAQTRLAVAHTPISPDPRVNGAIIRQQMRDAKALGAKIILFPEGAASGYVKSQIKDWNDVDWTALTQELQHTARLAAELGIWTVIGSAHRLESDHRPHNSQYILSPDGGPTDRYDKQFLSNSEITDWFSPGRGEVVFEVDGIRFGCAICIEINFPELFARYERLGVDAVLISTYSDNPDDALLARAHAHLNKLWIALAVPANARHQHVTSLVAGPDGQILTQGALGSPSVSIVDLDPGDGRWDIHLQKARPWRRRAREGAIYDEKRVVDPRSDDTRSF